MADTIKKQVEFDLSPDEAGKWFCSLDDEKMADFLIAVEKYSREYEGNPDMQWCYLGGHLKSCECSNEATRDMLRAWVWHMEHSTHD